MLKTPSLDVVFIGIAFDFLLQLTGAADDAQQAPVAKKVLLLSVFAIMFMIILRFL